MFQQVSTRLELSLLEYGFGGKIVDAGDFSADCCIILLAFTLPTPTSVTLRR